MKKICTSLDQSEKLIGLGINVNTADMYYDVNSYGIQSKPEVAVGKVWSKDIPCWSIAALLSVLTYPDIKQRYDGKWACRVENKDTTYLWIDSNPVDACVAVIEKLHEENIL